MSYREAFFERQLAGAANDEAVKKWGGTMKIHLRIATAVAFVAWAIPTIAAVEANWPAGTPNSCRSAQDGFIDFEGSSEGAPIQSTIPGTRFTHTGGYDWIAADWRTGNYNGPYPSGAYTSNGNYFAWLGPNQGTGRIDFLEGTATYVSLLASSASGVVLEAYDATDNLVGSSGWAGSNINTGKMARLTVEVPNISYVMVHDTGNRWLIDDLCTDAAGVPPAFNAATTLAKSAIGAKYQWGAKGYDFPAGGFVAEEDVKSNGYDYYDPDLKVVTSGTGLDCSGLSFWAFNRTFYADASVNWNKCIGKDATTRCPVFYEGADGQWRGNTTKKSGAPKSDDLRPGDLLFFDEVDTAGVMDHVAMYVGPWEFTQGEIFNVVHAHGWAKTNGVVPAWYNAESGQLITQSIPSDGSSQSLAVKAWGRISDPRLDAWVVTHSPVHLVVRDPEGQTVTIENTLSDTNGYTREVAGLSYMVKNLDGIAEDTVAIPELKPGAYFISVVPKPGVSPVETYSLEVRFPDLGLGTIWLAERAPVRNKTFVIEATASGPVQSAWLSVRVKPGDAIPCINPRSRGNIPIAILGQETLSVTAIDASSIRADLDSRRDTEGIPPQRWALDDVNKDGVPDLILHFSTTALQKAGVLKDSEPLFLSGLDKTGRPIIGFDFVHLVGGRQCR